MVDIHLLVHSEILLKFKRHSFWGHTPFGVMSCNLSFIFDHHGHDRMVVGFTTSCAISAYHGEVYWIQHYVIKFVSDLWQVGWFFWTLVSSTNKTDRHDITKILLKVVLNTITQ
jgi:hypothetical protein